MDPLLAVDFVMQSNGTKKGDLYSLRVTRIHSSI